VPCLAEGCDRHINSLSDCLQHLSANRVIAAAESMLTGEHQLMPGAIAEVSHS